MALITGRNHFTPIFSCESSSSRFGHFELLCLCCDSQLASWNAPRSTVASPLVWCEGSVLGARTGSAGLVSDTCGTGSVCLEDAALLIPAATPAMVFWDSHFCVSQKGVENPPPPSTQMNKENGDLVSDRALRVDRDSCTPLVLGLDALKLLPGKR